MIIISLLLARCLLGTWGDNLYPSSHSVFSIAQWNRNYQSHFTDGATGLWGQETYEVYAINGGGAKKHWNSQSLRFVCSTSPKTPQSTVSCGDLGYDSGFVTTVRCSALASLAPAYPSGLEPDLFPRLSSPCVSSGPAHHLSSWIWELYSSGIGGGWILWKCDSILLSSRQLDSL